MAKKTRWDDYPTAFRKMAVERLKSCDNIVALVGGTGGASAAAVQMARSAGAN